MQSIIRKIYNQFIPHLYYFPILRQNYISRKKVLLPLYKNINDAKEQMHIQGKTVILMVKNETVFCGGLSDRFRGIISVFQECKALGLNFKIYFETPKLKDYLDCNEYDWYIAEQDICYDTKIVYPCSILSHHPINDQKQPLVQKNILRWFLKKDFAQIHVYTNMLSGDGHYRELFHELFKPTRDLQELINFHLKQLGGIGKFQAMVFRFRQLLGDFKEGGEILPIHERENYIQRCISVIEKKHASSPLEKILVTSDSTSFLNQLSSMPFVYVIPGEVVHMGFTFDASKKTYMKSFVDYFVLSHAHSITLVRDKKMYHSGFALRAAMLNGAEYSEMWML